MRKNYKNEKLNTKTETQTISLGQQRKYRLKPSVSLSIQSNVQNPGVVKIYNVRHDTFRSLEYAAIAFPHGQTLIKSGTL